MLCSAFSGSRRQCARKNGDRGQPRDNLFLEAARHADAQPAREILLFPDVSFDCCRSGLRLQFHRSGQAFPSGGFAAVYCLHSRGVFFRCGSYFSFCKRGWCARATFSGTGAWDISERCWARPFALRLRTSLNQVMGLRVNSAKDHGVIFADVLRQTQNDSLYNGRPCEPSTSTSWRASTALCTPE